MSQYVILDGHAVRVSSIVSISLPRVVPQKQSWNPFAQKQEKGVITSNISLVNNKEFTIRKNYSNEDEKEALYVGMKKGVQSLISQLLGEDIFEDVTVLETVQT